MANKFRNEMQITIAGVEILLRPSFDNIANLESALGYGIPQFAYRLSKGIVPTMTDLARVVYQCQAEKVHTQEEIWQFIMQDGQVTITTEVLKFVGQITAGDKTVVPLSENQKKS